MTSQTLYSWLEGKQIVKHKHAVIVDGINVTIIGLGFSELFHAKAKAKGENRIL